MKQMKKQITLKSPVDSAAKDSAKPLTREQKDRRNALARARAKAKREAVRAKSGPKASAKPAARPPELPGDSGAKACGGSDSGTLRECASRVALDCVAKAIETAFGGGLVPEVTFRTGRRFFCRQGIADVDVECRISLQEDGGSDGDDSDDSDDSADVRDAGGSGVGAVRVPADGLGRLLGLIASRLG